MSHQSAKAHAFEKRYLEDDLEKAWDSLKETNAIIKNLHRHGRRWYDLPPHLIDDLMKRYKESTCS